MAEIGVRQPEGGIQVDRRAELGDRLVIPAREKEYVANLHIDGQGQRVEHSGLPDLLDGVVGAAMRSQSFGVPLVGRGISWTQLQRAQKFRLCTFPMASIRFQG